MIDDDDNECRAFGGMRIGRGNQSLRRKFAPVPHFSTTNPPYLDLG
jgi:hypothetical protein